MMPAGRPLSYNIDAVAADLTKMDGLDLGDAEFIPSGTGEAG
jgi:hypothetical protein